MSSGPISRYSMVRGKRARAEVQHGRDQETLHWSNTNCLVFFCCICFAFNFIFSFVRTKIGSDESTLHWQFLLLNIFVLLTKSAFIGSLHALTGFQHQGSLDSGSFQRTKDAPDLHMNVWLVKENGQAAEKRSSIRQIPTILVSNLVTLQFGVNTWKLHPIPFLFPEFFVFVPEFLLTMAFLSWGGFRQCQIDYSSGHVSNNYGENFANSLFLIFRKKNFHMFCL